MLILPIIIMMAQAVPESYYNHIFGTGQSLCVGATSTPTSIAYGRNIGLVNNLNASTGTGAFTPLVANTLERPGITIAANMAYFSGGPVNGWRIEHTSGCQGATDYNGLKKGNTPYTNAITAVSTSITNAGANSYKVLAIYNVHGEYDFANRETAATYQGYVEEWLNDFNGDIKPLTGQTEDLKFFQTQMHSWGQYARTTPTTTSSGYDITPSVPIGQLDASRGSLAERIILACPKYQFPYSDDLHLTTFGYQRLGIIMGWVMDQVLRLGQRFRPVSMRAVTMPTTSTIRARFWVPYNTGIEFDTTAVSEPSGTYRGFTFVDTGGSGTTITGASISGDTITFTLSGVPTGTNPRLAYAYITSGTGSGPTTGPRGNLRSSQGVTGIYYNGSAWTTQTEYHWGVTEMQQVGWTDPTDIPGTKTSTLRGRFTAGAVLQ